MPESNTEEREKHGMSDATRVLLGLGLGILTGFSSAKRWGF